MEIKLGTQRRVLKWPNNYGQFKDSTVKLLPLSALAGVRFNLQSIMADTPRIVNLSDTFKCNLMQFMARPGRRLPIQRIGRRHALLLCPSICRTLLQRRSEQRLLLKAETMRTSASIVRASAYVYVCVCVWLCICEWQCACISEFQDFRLSGLFLFEHAMRKWAVLSLIIHAAPVVAADKT